METTYKTRDLYQAAYLRSNEHQMREPEKQGSHLLFVFDSTPALQEHVREWVAGDPRVSAKSFTYNIKHLKTVCHM
jgi:hypothetical protein